MDADTQASCPLLHVFSFHEDLIVSSLSNAVGSVVTFECAGDENTVLSGSPTLLCTTAGKWNGSVPTCTYNEGTHLVSKSENISVKHDITTSLVSDTTESTWMATTESVAELEVETVLIVLWVAGGLLLITLVVLMACILRSHKKRRRNSQRSERFPRGQSHGGVNPTFSTYDEIWTWIPVLTDNAGNCRNQASDSVQGNSAIQTNNELIRNLRLPTYSEAVSSTTPVTRSSQSRARPVTVTSSSQRNHAPHRQMLNQTQNVIQTNSQMSGQRNLSENRNSSANTTRTAQVHRTFVNVRETRQVSNVNSSSRCHNNGSTNLTPGSTEHHHYETIPADAVTRSSNHTDRENADRVHVTRSSGSALQQARDLVDQLSAHAQRPQPSAPMYHHVSNESRREQHNSSHRAYVNPSSDRLTSASRSHAQPLPRYTSNQSSHEFRHSEGSRFEYYGYNSHRNRSTTISAGITEPPPPYSIVREPTSQTSGYTSGVTAARTSSALTSTSLRTGLECQYF